MLLFTKVLSYHDNSSAAILEKGLILIAQQNHFLNQKLSKHGHPDYHCAKAAVEELLPS